MDVDSFIIEPGVEVPYFLNQKAKISQNSMFEGFE